MAQKVLTPAEYAAQGYVLNEDFDASMFQSGSYTSPGVDVNFLNLPIYRSETKEEFYIDAAIGLFKVGGAFLTGGSGAAATAAWTYIGMVTEED